MVEILKSVFFVSLNLRGPDSLPGSRGMLAMCLIPWAAVSVTSNLMLHPGEQVAALAAAVLELALLFGYPWLVLRMAEKLERWPQTVVSLVGVQALIAAISLPFTYLAEGRDEPGLLLTLAGIAFTAWWLLAAANIFARSVGRSVVVGLVLSACQFFFTLMAIVLLFQALGVLPGEA